MLQKDGNILTDVAAIVNNPVIVAVWFVADKAHRIEPTNSAV